MAEIIRVTSEALQATVRRLLPSQQGFGDDLQATNLITPIIDLTPTAEGSALPDYLQRAINYVDANTFFINNTTTTVINTPGFWQINGSVSHNINAGVSDFTVGLNDGTTIKYLLNFSEVSPSTAQEIFMTYIELPVILVRTGDTLEITAGAATNVTGSCRQIADLQGNLNDPTGYVSQ